jgi:nicotinamide phosphoribosyltransferase
MQVPNLAKADSYKYSHYLQYPPGTEYVSSYIEARSSKVRQFKEVVFFGLQYYVDEYLTKPLVTKTSLDRMNRRMKQHGEPFNLEGFDYILTKHNGIAPVHVQALKEGSVVPLGTPLVQVVNTDSNVPFITSFIETNLLRLWYPCTVATNSFHIKRLIKSKLLETTSGTDALDFMLHDFGARGVSSSESSQLGGMAHLTCFKGTDNVEALEAAEEYYYEDMAGFSVPAAEHSTMTSWGGEPGEILAMENMIDTFGEGIFSVVSDSYDLFHAIKCKYGEALADKIKNLANTGGKLVVRPDSGNPTTVPVDVVIALLETFGSTTNSKGFSQLPSYLAVLQGDGINIDSIWHILQNARNDGLAASNFVFGMGGALLQAVDRDTLGFAMKASAIQVNGKWRDVFKDPKTDSGKKSKKGRVAVIHDSKTYLTVRADDPYLQDDLLEDVVINGEVKRTQTLQDIRDRINQAL